MSGRVAERRDGFERARDYGSEIDAIAAQLELVARDARHIEQVISQPDQLLHLTLGNRERALAQRLVLAGTAQQFQGISYWRERIAQLVRQRRQELILPPVRLAQHV